MVLCSSKMLQHIRVIYNNTTSEGQFGAVGKSMNHRAKDYRFDPQPSQLKLFFLSQLHSNIVLPSTNYLKLKRAQIS